MANSHDSRTASNVSTLSETTGIILMLVYFYVYCFPLFEQWHLTSTITNRILQAILRTGLYDDNVYSKLYPVGFILLGMLAGRGRKEPGLSWRLSFMELSIAFMLYLVTPLLWDKDYNGQGWYIAYIIITSLNLSWISFSAGRLIRYIPLPWARNDPFGHDVTGFPQLNKRLSGRFSLHLRTRYGYKGKLFDGWLNLVNPRRGVLIIGSPGSGKSYFIISPLIRQVIEKGMAVVIYDFKYDALTRIAYEHFVTNRKKYPALSSFYAIHFTDPSRSHRCNVLAPETMTWLADALAVSQTILLSLNKTWIDRQGDFFVESPINFLAALIWFLRQYEGGKYCTLPHVIELARLPYDELFVVLASEPSIENLIDPFLRAYSNSSTEMLDGQLASTKIPLARLSSPDIYYILTGNDLSLQINNPKAPAILCLGGDPNRSEALAPVLGLYLDRLNRICNQPKKHPCAIVCDEFATIRVPAFLTTMATGRSNEILPIIAVQDMAQLRTLYSRNEADWILNISGNVLCGQVGGDTAKNISDRFPKVLRERQSMSVNSADTSVSKHLEWEDSVSPATVAGQTSGEFVGVLADDPSGKMPVKIFQAAILRDKKDDVQGMDLPVVRAVGAPELQACYEQVKIDIAGMVAEVMRKVMDGADSNANSL